MTNSGGVGDRVPDDPSRRTHNHPNGVAIDISYAPNNNVPETDPRRDEPNSNHPNLVTRDVERILNNHGWQAGYIYNGRMSQLFHWSFSRT